MATGDGYSAPVWIEIGRIDVRPASEMRASTDEEALEAYAEAFDKLPPIKVVADEDDKHWLADGSYRVRTAIKLGKKKVWAVVRRGTYLDAFAEASRANDVHGVRVTNADKRRRVEAALAHPVMGGWSNSRIADQCGVGHPFVAKMRPEVESDSTSPPPKVVGKDGKSYPARKPKKPKPKPDPKPPKAKPERIAEADLGPVRVSAEDLPPADPAEIAALLAEPDDTINTSDIPEAKTSPLPCALAGRFNATAAFEEVWDQLDAWRESWPAAHRKSFILKLRNYVDKWESEYGIEVKEVGRAS